MAYRSGSYIKKPTLQETIKKSRDARLRAEREAQTARGEVKGLKESLRLKEQQFLKVV